MCGKENGDGDGDATRYHVHPVYPELPDYGSRGEGDEVVGNGGVVDGGLEGNHGIAEYVNTGDKVVSKDMNGTKPGVERNEKVLDRERKEEEEGEMTGWTRFGLFLIGVGVVVFMHLCLDYLMPVPVVMVGFLGWRLLP